MQTVNPQSGPSPPSSTPGISLSVGKFTPLTPSPGELEWEWFRSWREWRQASWVGPSNEGQLISLAKIMLSSDWYNAMEDFNWNFTTLDALYVNMDRKPEVLFPPLKRVVSLLTSLKKSPQETHIQFYARVKAAIIIGGIGTKKSFNLSLDRLMIIRVIKGLPNSDQCELLWKYNTFNITNDNLNHFLLTLTSVFSNNINNQQQINSIARGSLLVKNSRNQPKLLLIMPLIVS